MHSNLSWDGKITIKELSELALNQNFSFLCITDHLKKDLDIDALKKTCSKYTNNNLKIIPGIEIEFGKTHILSINNLIVPKTTDKIKSYNQINKIKNAIAILAHPRKKTDIRYFKNIESWNTKYHGSAPKIDFLEKNKIHFGGLDFHVKNQFGKVWIIMNVKKLETNEIIAKLKKGDFKISNGKYILNSKNPLKKKIFYIHNFFHSMYWFLRGISWKIRNRFPIIKKVVEYVR